MKSLVIGRYTAQGAAGILKDGLSSRKEVLEELAKRQGMQLLGMWGVGESDLDFVMLFEEGEPNPAETAANHLGQMSMGHLAEVRSYTLVETEDVDAAMQAVNRVSRAPGQA